MVKVQGSSVALWKRILAYVVDSLVLSFIVLVPLTGILESRVQGDTFWEMLRSYSSLSGDFFFLTLVISLLVLFYWSFLEYRFHQSVGKIFLGLSVESTKKKPLTFMQAVVRNVTKLSLLLLFFDTLYLLVKKKDQRYFEILSDTCVVEEVRAHEQTF